MPCHGRRSRLRAWVVISPPSTQIFSWLRYSLAFWERGRTWLSGWVGRGLPAAALPKRPRRARTVRAADVPARPRWKAGRVLKAPPARRNSGRLIERAYAAPRFPRGSRLRLAGHVGRHIAGTFEGAKHEPRTPSARTQKNRPPARAKNLLKSSVKIVAPGSRPDTDRS